jgi:hypothetical protein
VVNQIRKLKSQAKRKNTMIKTVEAIISTGPTSSNKNGNEMNVSLNPKLEKDVR